VVFIWDIPVKAAKLTGCRLWQEIEHRQSEEIGPDLEHIFNIARFSILSINQQQREY